MKEILIADAGSTKTDWSFLYGSDYNVVRIKSKGINPLLQSEEEISGILMEVKHELKENCPKEIYFFGAGCAGENINNSLKTLLQKVLKAETINVDSDLKGACISLFGKKSGIVAILGTGSNSCIYHEGIITDRIPSLGYILGDEGSGSALGKRLINNIFKRQLPKFIIDKFQEEYDLTPEEVIENVYRKPMASGYLASFSPFLLKNSEISEISEIIISELESFFIKDILPYKINSTTKLGFIGSVAFSYKSFLQDIAEKYGLQIEKIRKSPIEGLEIYFNDL